MEIVSRTDVDGKPVLALSTGLSEYAAAKSRLQRGSLKNGYIIIPDGTIRPWIPEGTFSRDYSEDSRVARSGILHIYGPDFNGTSLLDIIRSSDPAKAWKKIHAVLELIHRAGHSGEEHSTPMLAQAGQTGPAGIFLSDDGRILVLGEVFRRCLSAHGETLEREYRLEWVHPDCAREPAEKNLSFLAATLAYRIVGGVSPYMTSALWSVRDSSGEGDASFIAHLVRGGYVLPLSTIKPGISPHFSETILRAINGEHPDGLSAILAFGDSLAAIPSSAESGKKDTVSADRENSIRQMKGRLKRTVFLRKHSTKFILGGILAGFIALFGSMYVSDLHNKPSTAGMSPQDVVTGFYGAIAALDTNTITSYATTSAADEYIKLVSGMFMTNSILGRDTITGGFINPQQLFRDKLDATHTVYGITHLELEETGSVDDHAEFLVSFYLFLPEEIREMDTSELLERTDQPLTVYRYRDRCILTSKKDRWKITGIDQLDRSVVEDSGNEIFTIVTSGTGDTLPYAPR